MQGIDVLMWGQGRRGARGRRAVAALITVGLLVAAAGAGAASASGPTVSVTPSQGLADSGPVAVTASVTGATPGHHASFDQCATRASDGHTACQSLVTTAYPLVQPDGTATLDASVNYDVLGDGTVHCDSWSTGTQSRQCYVRAFDVETSAIFGRVDLTFAGHTTAPASDLDVSLAATPAATQPNGDISVVATVTNHGPDPATNVTLTVNVPANVSSVTAAPAQGSCSTSTNVSCALGTIASGAHAIVTISSTATTTGTATFDAQATAAETDSTPATASTSVTIEATNHAPVVVADTATIPVGRAVQLNVLENDTDADGNSLTITGSTAPAHGSAVCSTASCIYTPATKFAGTDTFHYTVTDGHGGSATGDVTVNVTPGNAAPTPAGDTVSVQTGQSVMFDVRANDSDPDGDTVVFESATAASHGTATCAPADDGVCSYVAADGYSGPDSFTYVVNDGHGHTATAAVSITVTAAPLNHLPITANDSATTTVGTPVHIAVTANDSDPDRDPLTATLDEAPLIGSATCSGGSCTYTPGSTSGGDSFTYIADDGHGGAAPATVTVVVNPSSKSVTKGKGVGKATAAPRAKRTGNGQFSWTYSNARMNCDGNGSPFAQINSSFLELGTTGATRLRTTVRLQTWKKFTHIVGGWPTYAWGWHTEREMSRTYSFPSDPDANWHKLPMNQTWDPLLPGELRDNFDNATWARITIQFQAFHDNTWVADDELYNTGKMEAQRCKTISAG